mgnify:FL=1
MLSRKHGKWKSSEYTIWSGIKQRCHNPKSPNYFKYGGRGIKVCELWRSSFEAFYSYVGDRPSKEYSLDRFPNNDGNYEPGNTRWATREEQRANTRAVVWERIVLLLSGARAAEVSAMVKQGCHDIEVARYIAQVYRPS